MENILISGITDEELKELHAWEIEHSHELGVEEGLEKGLAEGTEKRGYDAVERIVAAGWANAQKACEEIGVDYNAYCEWKTHR